MQEIGMNNCYDLYKEKFGESIKDPLEQTLTESQQEIDSKIESFVRKTFLNYNIEDSNGSAVTRILKEIIKSKNYLLNLLDSPYLNLYIRHKGDAAEMARGVTWHWLSAPKQALPLPTHLKFYNLKEILVSIGFHYSIYYGNDHFLAILKNNDPAIAWPEKENLEIYRIHYLEEKLKQFEERLIRQKEVQTQLESYNKKKYDIQKEAYIKVEKELEQKNDQLSRSRSEFKFLKDTYFFHEDRLYDNYVFGDILPELKSVYLLLKEYKIYESNWGYFCHCLTVDNYSTPEPLKLNLNLQGKDLDSKDIGYILNLLQNKFFKPQKQEYLIWLTKVVTLKSGLGKVINDMPDFYKKKVRPYKKGKSQPRFYDEINSKMSYFITRSS